MMKRRLMQQAAEAAAAAEGEAGGFREQALVFVPGQADDPFWDLQTELVRSPQSFAENKNLCCSCVWRVGVGVFAVLFAADALLILTPAWCGSVVKKGRCLL